MDTIVTPRHLSETESEGSVKGNSDDNLASRYRREPASTSGGEKQDEKIIICPTARFLQVNQKKISSYDLLVRPPKRPRLFTATTLQEEEEEEGVVEKTPNSKEEVPEAEETMAEGKTSERFPLEFLHFENETKFKPSTREIDIGLLSPKGEEAEENGNWTKQSNSKERTGSGKKEYEEDSNNNTERRSEANEDVTLIYRVIDEASASNISKKMNRCATKPFPPRCEQNHDHGPPLTKQASNQKSKQFSNSRRNMAQNGDWSQSSFQTIYKVVNEKDENKNFLPMENHSSVNAEELSQGQLNFDPRVTEDSSGDIVGGRAIKVPYYRQPESYRSIGTVFLKESDYDASMEQLKGSTNVQSRKKIRLDISRESSPDADNDENVKKKKLAAPTTTYGSDRNEISYLFQTLDNQSETVSSDGEVPVQVQEGYSDHTDPGVHVPSSLRLDNFIDDDCKSSGRQASFDLPEECGTFVAADFNPNEFPSSFINLSFDGSGFMSEVQMFDSDLFSAVGVEDGESIFPIPDGASPGSHDSPFAIFLQDLGSEPGFLFNLSEPSSFTDRPLSESRIEDVTDLELNEDEAIEHKNKSVVVDVDTILKARNPLASERDSGSCQSVSVNELLREFSDDNNQGSRESSQYSNLMKTEEQEYLVQPTTHLNYSTSLHSATEATTTEANRSSTTDKLIAKSTKSDYFVGKIHGLTKSVMKLYQKCTATSSRDSHIPSGNNSLNCTSNNAIPESKLKGKQSDTKKSDDPTVAKNEKTQNKEDGKGHSRDPSATSTPEVKASQSSLKSSLTTCYRKMSAGNRISNIKIPNSIQLNRCKGSGKSPDEAGDSEVKVKLDVTTEGVKDQTSSVKRLSQKRPLKAKVDKPVVEIGKPKVAPQTTFHLKSSSSSSMALKPQYFRKPPGPGGHHHQDKKKDSVDSSTNIVKRFTRLFSRAKKPKNRNTSEEIQTKNSKSIAQHTDSVELYRERRYRFFEEQKEFQDDSLKVYYKMLLNNSSKQNSLFGSNDGFRGGAGTTCTGGGVGKGTPLNLPVSSAIPVMKYLQVTESVESDVIIPARVAASESALPTSQNRPLRQNLVLQCPPILHMLALSAQGHSDSGQGGATGRNAIQEKFKRPHKGILKKRNNNDSK